jgi:hypothetical protein
MRTAVYAMGAAAAVALAACSDTTGVIADSFMHASVTGSVEAAYSGTGAFMIRSAGTPGPLFSVSSSGAGSSANQGFAFQAEDVPAAGDYAIGPLGPASVRATYWYDEGSTRKLFRAESGTLRIDESTAARAGGRLHGRVAGTFELSAELLYVCERVPGFPADFLVCDPAAEAASIQVTGSFVARPIGGDNPGLLLGDG